jgi:NAD(P)-dependent dehydrogenase (short-subunit alcohol dehydrogenase family)/acyl carrier protein
VLALVGPAGSGGSGSDPDGSGASDFIGAGLTARGSEVISVRRGDRYSRDESGYRVRPASHEDYASLLADLAARGGIPAHIVHCWTTADAPAASSAAAWSAQDDGFFSVLSLVQALAATMPDGGVHLDVVTAGTQEAIGRDVSRPEHATLAGLVKVLPLEFPWLTMRHIAADPRLDTPIAEGDGRSPAPASAEMLLDELCAETEPSNSDGEQLIALRNGRRWCRAFEDLQQPSSAGEELDEPAASGAILREHGVYLITGGLGGMGITIAEDLASRYQATLVLVARDGLPPRDRWDAEETTAAVPARARRAMAAIRRMEQAGAQVHVIPADVADPAAVHALHDEVMARCGTLNGIIHAAGVPGGGMAEIKDRDAAQSVLRPKLAGTLALRDAFADQRLDFVVLCSSVLALVGSFGQVDYAAANAFLDAHAASDHGWNARVVSVNWGAWLKVGMAAEVTAPAAFRALQRGQHLIPVRHGLITGRYPADGDSPIWSSGTISPDTHWVLADHRLTTGVSILPGTGHLEAARCAFSEAFPAPDAGYVVELSDVVFTQPLTVPDGSSAELRVILTPAVDGVDFEIRGVVDAAESVHSHGRASWVKVASEQVADLEEIRRRCSRGEIARDSAVASDSGLLRFGPHWSSVARVYQGDGEELALLEAQPAADEEPGTWTLHPAMLDEAIGSGRSGGALDGFLPFGYGSLTVRSALPARLWSHRRFRDSGNGNMRTADVTLYDQDGREIVRAEDFTLRKVDVASLTADTATSAEPVLDALQPAVGAKAFRRLVNAGLAPQVVISAKPVDEMMAASHRVDYQAVAEDLALPQVDQASTLPQQDAAAPRTERELAVAQVLGDLLGLPEIAADEDFFDAGGNSLIAVQLIALLRKQFGVRLPMRRFFESPTATGIAALIDELSASADPGAR